MTPNPPEGQRYETIGGKTYDLERLGVRMLHKVCPAKDTHGALADSHCPECGINRSDYERFIVGDEGKAT